MPRKIAIKLPQQAIDLRIGNLIMCRFLPSREGCPQGGVGEIVIANAEPTPLAPPRRGNVIGLVLKANCGRYLILVPKP